MNSIDQYISSKLTERKKDHALRKLTTAGLAVDFCSNDYLGFAASSELREMTEQTIHDTGAYPLGSTGSRLLSGNDRFTEELEEEIAAFHGAASALLFNSGYDANVGLFSALPRRNDTVIADELVHASIIDGIRLSYAGRYTFKHNDLQSLEDKLRIAKGNKYIAVESVYSMDGDRAPLPEMAALAERYGAGLIVDEAHATGIFGRQGRGLVSHYGLEDQVFATVITYGKAMGCHGAAVLGSHLLRDYLINFSRPFIYSTAASFTAHTAIKMAYRYLQSYDFQKDISSRIALFKEEAARLDAPFIPSDSTIQCLLTEGNERARTLAEKTRGAGFDVRAILHPTVQQGRERLRICLHTFNSDEDIKTLIQYFKTQL